MPPNPALRKRALASLALFALATVSGCGDSSGTPADGAPDVAPKSGQASSPSYVGKAVCIDCHSSEAERWSGSHHDLAMQPANEANVLGDFDDASFEKDGVRSRFFRRGDGFYVRTDGADGVLQDFEIGWTFGVEPLQQYLIAFPDGRIQALGIAWDTRPAAEGGQRWFHVYGDEKIPAGDELHWTGLSQNWNFMCAECHSTGYRKGYDPEADRFTPEWTDVDVACEACHGRGSVHVERARADDWSEGAGLAVEFAMPGRRWIADPGAPTRRLEGESDGGLQVESCARCHSRRASIRAEVVHGQPLLDMAQPSLLLEPLYFPDGQIRDEVYVYGSFLQSRMHAAGVVCSDCHDSHSLSLRAEGDALCLQCHDAGRFASSSHHHHPSSSEAPSCVDCHMPSRRYMVVDERRDHGFRVPRPDLSAALGVTDACAACHGDRPAGWSAEAMRGWLGRDATGLQQFAETFRAAGTGGLESSAALLELVGDPEQPAIVRATALRHLEARPTRASLQSALAALEDEDPLVRWAALGPLRALPPDARVGLLASHLADPIRAVRIEVARMLAGANAAGFDPLAAARLREGLVEYEDAQRAHLDRPHARLNLAGLHAERGHVAAAEQEYRAAIALDPRFVPARVNLADLLAAAGREDEAGSVLREGLEVLPGSGVLHHALGLHRVRAGQGAAALVSLARAVEQAPDETRFRYVYAVALAGEGRSEEARTMLEEANRRDPADVDVLWALVDMEMKAGNADEALARARALALLQPDDPRIRELIGQLEN